MNRLAKRWIGNRDFYVMLLTVTLPIMAQNAISNFVGLLDNIMVGRIGTEQLSGVSIVNDLLFVMYLCMFGAISGAGIFTAQFYGQKNMEGVRDTVRVKTIICGVILVVAMVLFITCDKQLISLFLHEGSESVNLAYTLECAEKYLKVMLFGLLPYTVECVYSSTLRATGETVVPMKAAITAVLVNLVLNYILIFGKLGLPAMGVVGAAWATVISRFVQMGMVVFWTQKHLNLYPFMVGAFSSLRVSADLIRRITITGFPLLMNESLWSFGIMVQKQSYSMRGLAVIAGLNINSTVFNLSCIAFSAMGDAVGILVGQMLGAGKLKEAKETAIKIIAFTLATCLCVGAIVYGTAGLMPEIYNTTEEVKSLAAGFIRVTGIMIPVNGVLHVLYFCIRSGGKTFITFLFDSGFLWVVSVPAAYLLVHLTALDILWIFAICEGLNMIKVVIGFILFEKGVWIHNIVG